MRTLFTLIFIGLYVAASSQADRSLPKISNARVPNRALNVRDTGAIGKNAVLCTGSLGEPVVNITFGAGNNPGQSLPTIVPGASTSLSFISVNGNPAAPTPVDGQYTITNNVPGNFGNWHSGEDHTPGDVNGFMAFYNSQETAGLEFYRQTVSNLCGSTTYEFAAWVANCLNPAAMNGVDPNITFVIESTNGNPIASYNTGDIAETSTLNWNQYGFFFTMPANETTVVLKMINNNVGGNALPGNDLAIDDITFRPCGPASSASFVSNIISDTLTVCEGELVNLYGNLSPGYNTPNYRWQESNDTGKTWFDLPSSNLLQYAFTVPVTGLPRFKWYRLIAGDGININSSNCRVGSNRITLKIRPAFLCTPNPNRTPISGIINRYTEVVGFDICKNIINVNDASAFSVGDTVIIAQMKGALIDSTNSSAFGNLVNYREAGNYEYNYIAQKNGNELVLRNVIIKPYDVINGKVQLVRVPYYISATITAPLTSQPWNGSTGGILALNVRDSLILQADIDVSGMGFAGGKATNTRVLVTNCSANDYFYPQGNNLSAPKGESIANIGSGIMNGKGAPASGGGGGLDHNSGGGGGGNGGIGGFGGYQLEACTNAAFDNRGIGGRALAYNNTSNKIFLGGGGGAGHCNQPLGLDMNGGNGGGIAIIKTGFLYTDGYKILSKGANAVECFLPNMDNCHDGNGGGGAGGTILLDVANYLFDIPIDVSGGKGGDLTIYNLFGGGRIGPGGGGSGGITWINNNATPTGMTIANTGGKNGVIPLDNNNPWGSTPGQIGATVYNLRLPFSTVPFQKNIDSLKVADTVLNCKAVRIKASYITRRNPIVNWQWDIGDGSVINNQSDTITHVYSNSGVYPIKLIITDINGCKDSITTSATINIVTVSATTPPIACINEPVNLQSTASGATRVAWTPALFLNDSTLQNPVAIVNTTTRFYVRAINQLGCYDTASVLVSIHPKPVYNAPPTPNAICIGSSVQLNGNNGNQYSYRWSPSTFLNDSTLANPTVVPDNSLVYTLRISESNCNYDSTFTVFVRANPNPVVSASASNDIDCVVLTAQLSATGANTYSWSPATALSNPNIANPVTGATSTTSYIVTGTNQFGCSSKDTVNVKVTNDGNPIFELPNAFTPNGDGKNECFGIRRWGNVTVKQFSIYNRWGQMVFTTKNPFECWDGTINGNKQPTGGFTYVIIASSRCGEVKKTGIVMLIR